jgi:CheY-like chemotaxis protein
MMPGGINGLVLAERVRQRMPDLPVLFATGYMDELSKQDINTSSYVMLVKPYRRTELADRIRAALNAKDAASGNTSSNFRHEG